MYLNCHSYYSFRYGVFSEDTLLQIAQQHQITKLVLTDINNTSACLNFIRRAPSYGVNPVIGIDFRNNDTQLYIGIAKNNQGFQELNSYLSIYKQQHEPLPQIAQPFQHAFVVYPYKQLDKIDKTTLGPNEYIGISPDDINRFRFSKWKSFTKKCVVLQTITFRNKRDYSVHRLLRAIDKNILLSQLQPQCQAAYTHQFITPANLRALYKDLPELISNTEQLLEQCAIHFDFSENRKPQNIASFSGSLQGDKALLQRLCNEGLPYRYGRITPDIQARVSKEIDMIARMNYNSFFLTNWDIVQYAKHKGYYHVGRGSGANSIVAYLLGITDVDPIALDLYFERFMNLYRTSPPDFDIDFSTRDRPDVTRYIFDRYNKNGQTALLAAYSTFQQKATIRELGKVFGFPSHEIEALTMAYTKPDDVGKLVLRYAGYIEGMPNHLTVHSAGILIAEKSIHYFSATDMPPKGFPTVQFDMHIAEDVGLYKYDILGQRGLGKIKETLDIIKYNQPNAPDIDIHNTRPFMTDEKVNALISEAKCIGCFYVESPAMRMLLKKLKVNNYLSLVAASSIIRPGVAKSGMMREYILRHKNPERRKDAHPVMAKIMPETYGIMVYQEDVIKVAHHFVGLDLGEADVLRRGMSGKYRSREEFQVVKDKFINNCRAKGYPDELTNEVWRQIESFAGYAFAKGHSASYAVESYQSLYLKTYYPLEYMVAVLNNGGGFYQNELYIHEVRMLGATIQSPCVNDSHWETVIRDKTIILGFQLIHGIETETIRKLLHARAEHGTFSSLNDVMERVAISPEQLELLIRVGAFAFTNQSKRQLLWYALFHQKGRVRSAQQHRLFKPARIKEFVLPDLAVNEYEHAFDQMELLGFSLMNPFRLVDQSLFESNIQAEHLKHFIGERIMIYGYLITTKRTTTSKRESMHFGTFIDTSGDWIDTVHFPNVAATYPFRGKGVYKILGTVVSEFDFLTIEVDAMEKLPMMEDPRYAETEKLNNIAAHQ